MPEPYATGPNGERYMRKADYQAARSRRQSSANRRRNRVLGNGR